MKSISSTWFEVGVRYTKLQQDGTSKNVTERYVVDALSFTEAEAGICSNIGTFTDPDGDYSISSEIQASYKEVVFSEDSADKEWFKVKLQFISLDEKNGKEKYSSHYFLVQGSSLAKALKNTQSLIDNTMVDYNVVSVTSTKVKDVFTYRKKEA